MPLTESMLPPARPQPTTFSSFTDVQLSHLRTKMNNSVAAKCHAMRYRLAGPVNLEKIRRNFADLTIRREARFDFEAAPRPKLWMESVPALSESEVARRRRAAEIRRPIEALGAPLFRCVLLQYHNGVSDLVLVAHRAGLDRYSLEVIAQAILRGIDALPPVPASQRFTAADCMPAHLRLQELQNASYCSRADWGLGTGKTGAGESQLSLRTSFPESIDPASFTAAVGLVLARYSGRQTPVVAALVTHPERPAGALGAYEGVTLIPVPCFEALSAGELLRSTAHRMSNPSPWYTPNLMDTLAASCENGAKVLVGAFFVTQDRPADAGWILPADYLPCLAAPFPLTITCAEEVDGTSCLTCLFQPKDFMASVAAQFLDAIVRAHWQLCRNPQLALAELDVFNPGDRKLMAAVAQPNRKLLVQEERIEQAFARRVAQTPHAPALTYEERHLTYRELDEEANQMAGALREHGVRAGDLVGVCLERSLELVAVLLAVLKAGAAYVPMDSTCPGDRLAYMIGDAKIGLVIASGSDFPAGKDIQVLHPEDLLQARSGDADAPLTQTTCDETAYIIYTSGSTGRPKGVVVPHRNVISLLAATSDDFGLCSADTWTLFHSSAFDFSVWEIWGCLLTGGHLVVVPYWVSRSAEEFSGLLAKERVTVLNQTPSAFAQLLDIDCDRPLISTLRLVIFGGEPLDTRMLLRWFNHHPESECRVVNMFGITETTVHVTLETITRREALAGSRSVGRALPGWHFYVMDTQGRLVPPGVAGEIYVGGAGVASFYLNRPELTAERFVPDPFTGTRMYRSGDKGRLRPDGRLEHLGRLDTQVKIRGFRIELDEIRCVLLEAPGVLTAAVIMHCDDPENAATAKLHAYVVLQGSTVAQVYSHLRRVLPDYMVPSALAELPLLPLTDNGKLDTARLLIPVKQRPADLCPPPLTGNAGDDLASALLNIWQKVLGGSVSLDDNFFDLGGNSLYAMRVATMMRNQGLPPLSVRQLYVHQTIRRLVASSVI
jgi:amino acid adenylation domain-containing protein